MRLSWDDVAERGADPVTGEYDFEGYRIYRSTDPEFRDPQVITTGTGSGPLGNGRPDRPVRSRRRQERVLGSDRRGGRLLSRRRDRDHPHLDRHHGHQRPALLLRGLRLRLRIGARALRLLPVGERDHASRARRAAGSSCRGTWSRCGPIRGSWDSSRPMPIPQRMWPAAAGARSAIEVVNSGLVPDGHLFAAHLRDARARQHPCDELCASRLDSRGDRSSQSGRDLEGAGYRGRSARGSCPSSSTQSTVLVDSAANRVQRRAARPTPRCASSTRTCSPINRRRLGFPETSPYRVPRRGGGHVDSPSSRSPPTPAKFKVFAARRTAVIASSTSVSATATATGPLSRADELIDVVTYLPGDPGAADHLARRARHHRHRRARSSRRRPRAMCSRCSSTWPYGARGRAPVHHQRRARRSGSGAEPSSPRSPTWSPIRTWAPRASSRSASPSRGAASGGSSSGACRRGATIRIYTVRGELVQTLRHDGSNDGFVAWDLRTKDNLDVAPGLYIFHVDGGDARHLHRQVRDHQVSVGGGAMKRALLTAAAVSWRSCCVLAAAPAGAQTKTGTTLGQFLGIEPSARTRGHGQRRRWRSTMGSSPSTTTRRLSAA